MQQQQILLPTLPYLWPKLIWHLLDKVHPIRKLHCNFARYVVLHQLWINQASSRLEHVWKPKFGLEHARALKNSTWSSFCPGIWPKMHYFCQNLSIFKGCIASSMKKSSIEQARACSGATLVKRYIIQIRAQFIFRYVDCRVDMYLQKDKSVTFDPKRCNKSKIQFYKGFCEVCMYRRHITMLRSIMKTLFPIIDFILMEFHPTKQHTYNIDWLPF